MSITHLNPLSAVVAKQEAEIARLREALALIVQWDGAGLALCEHHFEQARAALTTKGMA